jgi:AcrR family transcriptional regulator
MAESGRGRKGEHTRQAILHTAMALASVEGLEGLTIGRLATELGMSKSGLFAHFGSKEELQLATVDAAGAVVRGELEALVGEQRGLAALRAAVDGWLNYIERRHFPGGCFFSGAAAEFDARPGPLRDRIAATLGQLRNAFASFAAEAQAAGELKATVDPEQLAFEIQALGSAASFMLLLYDDPRALVWARRAITERFESLGTTPRDPAPTIQ